MVTLALFVSDLFSLHAHVITVTGRLHVLAVTYQVRQSIKSRSAGSVAPG